jgi:hypothetical protein
MMTLQQLATIKRWHLSHPRPGSVEQQVWDGMLTCWILGWMGVPPALVLAPELAWAICPGLFLAPTAYVRLRVWLHRRGLLRCDWLGSTQR